MRYLYDKTEKIILEFDSEIFEHPYLSTGNRVISARKGEAVGPLHPGHYLIYEDTGKAEKQIRYLGIAGDHSVIMQMTVGVFTADTFDSVAHAKRVPLNYYIGPTQVIDSTFRGYEQDYGDALYPHMMPNQFGIFDESFHQLNSNWESLTTDEIVIRLQKMDEYFQGKGLRPLHGFATYTPSNSLIEAMKRLKWNVLHSIVPEQNWSDGHWAINHWGMVNQPFYAASDDFRKPARRAPAGEPNVLEMTMNSYHLYMPHVVHFGDNVLSPSHFLRWHRTVESGAFPERFRNFLVDYLKVAEFKKTPFFLIAGFEFGRTFGVRSMTKHNRRGMEIVLDMAKKEPIVFATGRDVAAYYERFCPVHPEIVFTQRDYLAGTRIMDKPVNSGPSIGMEMEDYKAVFAHLDLLPYYHYDYTEVWSYKADDTSAPHDYAESDRNAVRISRNGNRMLVDVASPLERKVPVALWDALPRSLNTSVATIYYPPVLDDNRKHSVLLLPAGFTGRVEIDLEKSSEPPAAEFQGLRHPLWRVQTIGTPPHRQCYLYLEFPLLKPLKLKFQVPKRCRIDSLERPLGEFEKNETVELYFDFRHTWFRFYGLTAEEIQPSPEAIAEIERAAAESADFFEHAEENLRRIHEKDDAWFASRIPEGERIALDVDCFGNHVFGERSRARKFDRLVRSINPALSAIEYSDGGISLGGGKSFWVHPRGLHFVVAGLDHLPPTEDGMVNFYLYNTTPKENANPYRYHVYAHSNGEEIFNRTDPWICPYERTSESLLKLTIPQNRIVGGEVEIFLRASQMGVLDDWFADGGFIAALERILVTIKG